MPVKKGNNKKGGFSLVPITLSEPVKQADGFTNLIETPAEEKREKPAKNEKGGGVKKAAQPEQAKRESSTVEAKQSKENVADEQANEPIQKEKSARRPEKAIEKDVETERLNEKELLRILDADSLNEIYELTDVLRASSLKLYAALVQIADTRGRVRVKNHELMSKAGIKGIATLYKQERWLMDLKLLEKKAKPGPHDGSSYVVYKLESLPLPAEIYEKFDEYMSGLK